MNGPGRAARRAAPPHGVRRLARAAALAVALAALAAAGARPATAAGITVGFQQPTLTVSPGDTFLVQIVVSPAGDPFNAFDAPIRFDPVQLTFVPTSPVSAQRGVLMTAACSNTFHVFNARPDSLQITLSLLCNQVFVTGPGTVYQVKFRAATTPGVTTLRLGPSTAFFAAGFLVQPLVRHEMVVQIGAPASAPPRADDAGVRLEAPFPNPARGGRGMVRFALPAADDVRLEVLDVQGRRLATLAAGPRAAGEHTLAAPGGLAPGVYRVRLATGSGAVRERRWVALE
uniref:T9SS type A sorting domain-containing protein n=1 Tax=Eiseniibacteriota bacterium TaxID=2212470 RepID=A0A832I0F1_UNCEI